MADSKYREMPKEDFQSQDCTQLKHKVFNDPVHGHFELPAICVQIIDTPQFQRLRHLKQLGCCYYVYPGASHNRFEHCIGVCHLAGELAKKLQSNQRKLRIDDKDVLCVQIAGLCHDLGHGPLSHTFDSEFMKHPEIRKLRKGKDWRHEDASIAMFEHLLSCNPEVYQMFYKTEKLDDNDKLFIKEQIACSGKNGRGEDKWFLYDIVANERSGIDVDKWDYLARDCHHLGLKGNFDHKRFIHFSRVLKGDDDDQLQICCRDKEAEKIYGMYHVRWQLHKAAYQHKTTKIIERMFAEALVLANDYIFLSGTGGKQTKLSDAVDDMEAYTKLNDSIFQEIRSSRNDKLKPAQYILSRIDSRQLYKLIGEATPKSDVVDDMEAYTKLHDRIFQKIQYSRDDNLKQAQDILSKIDCRQLHKLIGEATPKSRFTRNEEERLAGEISNVSRGAISASDVVVQAVSYDYGKKGEELLRRVLFYKKNNPNKCVRLEEDDVSQMLPQKFSEQKIRLYCRKRDDTTQIKAARASFKECCITTGYKLPGGFDDEDREICELKNSEGKLFNDPIHGSMVLPPLCVTIIDTPEFQRLRNIKQLGGCYHVYPGASHNRFEHSLGVCYLAREFLKHLIKKQNDEPNAVKLDISETDILCVQVAGLCHELGQGPLSKVFEKDFMLSFSETSWDRKKVSVAMFHYIIECNSDLGLRLTQNDITFISELINPPAKSEDRSVRGLKAFLYNIVANEEDGIDVDKWDYLARDCHHLGIPSSFGYRRMMHYAHVEYKKESGDTQITWRPQEAETLDSMFNLRQHLHKVAYQHKTTQIIESMYSEVLQLANNHLAELIDWERANKAYREKVGRQNSDSSDAKQRMVSKDITISAAASEEGDKWAMQIYSLLNDEIFQLIANSEDKSEEMKKAKKILEMIEKRQHYKFVDFAVNKEHVLTVDEVAIQVREISNGKQVNESKLQTINDVISKRKTRFKRSDEKAIAQDIANLAKKMFTEDEIVVRVVHIGMENTMANPSYYDDARVSFGTHKVFRRVQENIRLYFKKYDASELEICEVRKVFKEYCVKYYLQFSNKGQ